MSKPPITTSKSHELIDIPLSPSRNVQFEIGDTVRSYRCGFDNQRPYANSFIEGVVIGMESWTRDNDYLIVKWHTDNCFGVIHKFKSVLDGGDTFRISTSSPHLVRLNKLSLTF